MFKLIREDSGVGIVCAVGKRQVFVAPLLPEPSAALSPAPHRKYCTPKAGCGSCGGCAALKDGFVSKLPVYVENPEDFKPGDRVAFSRFVPNPVVSNILLFGLPAAMTIAAIFFWLAIAPERAETAAASASVVAAFIGGIVISCVIDSLFRKRYPSTLTRGHYDFRRMA